MVEEILHTLFIPRETIRVPAANRKQPACEGKEASLDFTRYRFPIQSLALALTLVLSSLAIQSCLFPSLTQAQVPTAITSDGTLSTQVGQNSNAFDITGGTRPGNGPNLFHSFGQFSVGEGDVANFLNNTGTPTSNILSRVTGGNSSNIFGTIQTQGFGSANLFLMNPAGIIFGPGAFLNVGGAAHFTTADYLRLIDNIQFTATPSASEAVLSMAPVTAFGFLNEKPAGIEYDGSSEARSALNIPIEETLALQVQSGETLSLIGGDIQITGNFDPNEFNFDNTQLVASGGQVNVVSVASSGEVVVENSGVGTDYNVEDFDQFGAVNLTDGALLDAAGDAGGTVLIRSGTLVFDTSDVFADTQGGQDGAPSAIDIDVKGDITVIDGFVVADSVGSGKSGDIRISSKNLRLAGTPFDANEIGALIGSRSDPFGEGGIDGPSGNIELNIESLQIEGQAEVTTATFGPGDAGDITVNADNVFISGTPGSVYLTGIFANNFDSGSGGSIQVAADNVVLTNDGSIQSTTSATGDAGNITLDLTGRLDVQPGSFILGRGVTGNAANIDIIAQDIFLTGISDVADPTIGSFMDRMNRTFTGIDSSAEGSGLGGKVTLTAGNVQVTDQAIIRTSTSGSGNGGIIEVSVGELFLLNGASVTAGSTSGNENAGDAGNIQLTADGTILLDGATVTTEATQASGGNINLQAQELIRLNDSTISSSVQGSATTVGGNISLDPEFIILQNSQILARAVEGQGGNISLVATNAVLADPLSVLDASSALGVSGSVDIQAPIQNLSGTIAPLPEETTPVTALYGAHCAAGQGGNFSTFVDSKADSLSPAPGTFLSSPLLPPSAQAPTTTHALNAHEGSIILTASLAPLVLGQSSDSTTVCP